MSNFKFQQSYGCGDGGCVFRMGASPKERGGMHTNGGCRCFDFKREGEARQRAKVGVHVMAARITLLESFIADYMPEVTNG